MAITVEQASAQSYEAAAIEPMLFPYTMVNSTPGAGRVLLVAVSGTATNLGGTSTGATYNGVALARQPNRRSTMEDQVRAVKRVCRGPLKG